MKIQFICFFLTLFSIISGNPIDRFNNWLSEHKIQFNEDSILPHLFENWLHNDKYIDQINAKNLTYKLGHNHYSGMNSDEFSSFMNFEENNNYFAKYSPTNNLRGFVDVSLNTDYTFSSSLPSSIDWRTKNVVTPVKDQGQCGSCYSFSNTGALEGIYALTSGKLLSFSEQQIVDCSTIKNKGPNMGCNGGQIGLTMDWIGNNGGLCLEDDYVYISGETKTAETCKKTCSPIHNSKIISHADISISDNDMMTALSKQPVAVAIEADQKDFQLYKSGVFVGECGTNLDHAVLLVGYGSMNGNDYYIMKNSWSTSWGDKGYMYLGKGIDPNTGKTYNNGNGQCGVLMAGSYPVLSS
jgi:C1A family cysteine protease